MSRSLQTLTATKGALPFILNASILIRALPSIILIIQCGWFYSTTPQPLVFDAGQYVALSTHWSWWGPFPTLPADGLRTYAYPVLISLAGSIPFLLLLQCIGLGALMWGLRWNCLPRERRYDVALSLILLAFPILVPYALTVLADLPGIVALQGSLLVCALAMFSNGHRRWGEFALAGGLLSWSIQLRPAFAHVVWMLIVAAVWIELKLLLTSHERPSVKEILRRWCPLTAGVLCFVLVASPTLVVQARENHRLSYLPGDETNRLLGYHLMLGLSLDRWSSNPPPLEERHEVEVEWQKRGWAMLPVPPNVTPSIKDFKREVRKHPGNAAWQFIKHVYYAFAKFEFFPYAGHPSFPFTMLLALMNLLVLTLGTGEAIRRMTFEPMNSARLFAALQLGLLADLVLTCGLVVPEERFTLAIYPALIVFTAGALTRFLRPRTAMTMRGGSLHS